MVALEVSGEELMVFLLYRKLQSAEWIVEQFVHMDRMSRVRLASDIYMSKLSEVWMWLDLHSCIRKLLYISLY